MRLNRDGSFSGEFSDYDAYAEKDFPKGTVAICEFEGKFILYMPETPIEQLSEEFLAWWPSWYYSENELVRPDELSCYGLCNEAMQYGFFSYDGMAAFETYISR